MLRTRALCIWLGFGFAHGGHWLFLAAKARVQRPRTHLGAAAQPRVAQVVPAHGQEMAVFVEPPPPELGCALCGKAVIHEPAGIDFSFGPQPQPCTHAFCKACLEAELAVSWGCPTCGDNNVWKFETRWKGLADVSPDHASFDLSPLFSAPFVDFDTHGQVVEDRPEVSASIAALRCHCRHGVRCERGADVTLEHTTTQPEQ